MATADRSTAKTRAEASRVAEPHEGVRTLDEPPRHGRDERHTYTRTNIVLNDALIREARELTGLRAKREIVEEALKTLVRVTKQRQALGLFGKLPWDGDLQEIRRGRSLTIDK